jgi:hypothetical protein
MWVEGSGAPDSDARIGADGEATQHETLAEVGPAASQEELDEEVADLLAQEAIRVELAQL